MTTCHTTNADAKSQTSNRQMPLGKCKCALRFCHVRLRQHKSTNILDEQTCNSTPLATNTIDENHASCPTNAHGSDNVLDSPDMRKDNTSRNSTVLRSCHVPNRPIYLTNKPAIGHPQHAAHAHAHKHTSTFIAHHMPGWARTHAKVHIALRA